MYERKIDKEFRCPLEYGLDLICGKWKTRVICMLAQKEVLRYNELKEELIDVTDAVLSKVLKELMDSDMLARVQYNEIPLRVEYSLTRKAQSLVPILEEFCNWSLEYVDDKLSDSELCHGYVETKGINS